MPMLAGMTYITYGPAPTSQFRSPGTPTAPLLASPLDAVGHRMPVRERGAPAPEAALRGAGLVLGLAAAALALRLALAAAGWP